MAGKYTGKPESKYVSNYPSEYGSHKSMINDDYIDFNSMDHGYIICKDDHGSYVTTKSVLDTGFCDYNRSVERENRESILKECLNGNFKNVR